MVLVTAAYVGLTWRLVQETRDAREQEAQPVLKLELEPYFHGALTPTIKNVGNGPATDLDATIKLNPQGEQNQVRTKNLSAGDSISFFRPGVGTDHEDYDNLTVEGKYSTIFGKRVPFKDVFDLDILREVDEVDPVTPESKQLQYLEKIEESLSAIAEEMDRFGLHTKLESREKIIELLKEHGSLTVKELSEETGVNPAELGAMLTFLRGAGAVEYETDDGLPEPDVEVRVKSSK